MGDQTRGTMDDHMRPRLPALRDGFGGPAVTSSRCGHCHPSLLNIGPRSGGRRDGCRTPPAEQQHRMGDQTRGIIATLQLAQHTGYRQHI